MKFLLFTKLVVIFIVAIYLLKLDKFHKNYFYSIHSIDFCDSDLSCL